MPAILPSNDSTPWDELARSAYQEFSDALDFTWKSPELIELQERIELKKLRDYYPHDVEMRNFRWSHESQKLYGVFPMLMSSGNLFTVVSLFEFYLFRLAKLAESLSSIPLDQQSGLGFKRMINYLRSCGINPAEPALWNQVDAAMKVRNCLMHASGILLFSREEQALRHIVQSRTFLSREDRARDAADEPQIVTISVTTLGDRLQIQNEYSWLATAYLRDYVIGLCAVAKARFMPPETA